MENPEIEIYELLKQHNFSEENLKKFISSMKDMFTEQMATKSDLSELKSTLTWRMFIFWLGQVAATLAIIRYALV